MLSIICGAGIGFERETRLKTAGIRTHIIVSLGSALMMIISKYGFGDVLQSSNIGLDPSRIAAGIVTAVGFIGAGVIFVRNQTISGVTTAAGIWGNGWNRHGNRKRNVHYWYCYNGFIGDSSTVAAPQQQGIKTVCFHSCHIVRKIQSRSDGIDSYPLPGQTGKNYGY